MCVWGVTWPVQWRINCGVAWEGVATLGMDGRMSASDGMLCYTSEEIDEDGRCDEDSRLPPERRSENSICHRERLQVSQAVQQKEAVSPRARSGPKPEGARRGTGPRYILCKLLVQNNLQSQGRRSASSCIVRKSGATLPYLEPMECG